MRRPRTMAVLLLIALFASLPAEPASADVFSLKLLSNHAPDLTDVKSFGYSGSLAIEREVGDQAARVRDVQAGVDFLRRLTAQR